MCSQSRRRRHDPVQPRAAGPVDRQSLTCRRAISRTTQGAALLAFLGSHTRRDRVVYGGRCDDGAGRQDGRLQFSRRPGADARHQQAGRHGARCADPCGSYAGSGDAARRTAGSAVPGDRRHVDVEPTRGRRGSAAAGPASRLGAGTDQVGVDADRQDEQACSRKTASRRAIRSIAVRAVFALTTLRTPV